VTAKPSPTGVDPGLMERFQAAGARIAWRDTPAPRGTRQLDRRSGSSPRIAHLNDEEARVEERTEGKSHVLTVDSGPVGALVLLLRWEERGSPSRLVTHEAGELPSFPSGALEARWEGRTKTPTLALPLSDVVALARYALA
jgi:hypothetical protein